MTNANCLEGIKCPECGNEERLLITASAVVEVTDDGADVASPMYGSGFEWDDTSTARCPNCGCHGPLARFRAREGLPPDPEGMNDERAHWAHVALVAFEAETGTDREDAAADLLCDLMHWCDRNGGDFARQLDRARWHYEAETAGDLTDG